MVQKLSNRVIDLEKEKEENKQYKPYYKKRDDSVPSKPHSHSPSAMNLTEVGMENLCTFHQQPNSEKNFAQWINSMTLVMNQLLDSKLMEIVDGGEKDQKPIEIQEEDTMDLWDCAPLFSIEDEGFTKEEKISETNVTTRSQGPLK